MKFLERCKEFVMHPHVPYFLIEGVRKVSPAAARFLAYGRYNPNTKKYWDQKYEEYRVSDAQEQEDERRYATLRQGIIDRIPQGARLLDVGCGSGRFMELLRAQKQCTCTGLDISQVAVDLSVRKGFTAFRTELPNIPAELPSAGFDVITTVEVLEHISDPDAVIKALTRLVKPGGLLIVGVPEGCMSPDEVDEHVSEFDGPKLRGMFESGFSVVNEQHVTTTGHTYLVMTGKRKTMAAAA
ncbi:MAG: class I SAM-dependent methyltransferase [Nitrospirae bacterium]|nr:class I SAM-dependent methyltransferase [Nitrospirota bacterium]